MEGEGGKRSTERALPRSASKQTDDSYDDAFYLFLQKHNQPTAIYPLGTSSLSVLRRLPRAGGVALQCVHMQCAACGVRSPTRAMSMVQLRGCASAGCDLWQSRAPYLGAIGGATKIPPCAFCHLRLTLEEPISG
jgi:hypothetical protein